MQIRSMIIFTIVAILVAVWSSSHKANAATGQQLKKAEVEATVAKQFEQQEIAGEQVLDPGGFTENMTGMRFVVVQAQSKRQSTGATVRL